MSRARTSGAAFTYTGERNEATGLEFLRARYYDAGSGRFMSKDPPPWERPYAYVNNTW